MKIDPSPPGLISRKFFPIDRGRWVMQEEWNIDTPGCPMIRNPWQSQLAYNGPLYIRQVEMTAEEYQDMLAHGDVVGGLGLFNPAPVSAEDALQTDRESDNNAAQ